MQRARQNDSIDAECRCDSHLIVRRGWRIELIRLGECNDAALRSTPRNRAPPRHRLPPFLDVVIRRRAGARKGTEHHQRASTVTRVHAMHEGVIDSRRQIPQGNLANLLESVSIATWRNRKPMHLKGMFG